MAWQSFEELEVYKACRLFRKEVALIVKSFPKQERFLISSQVLDSSRSVTANIAEGHGRFHIQENIQFCRIARGSLSETLEHLICAYDEAYINKDTLQKMKTKYSNCLKLLNGYIKYLKSRK